MPLKMIGEYLPLPCSLDPQPVRTGPWALGDGAAPQAAPAHSRAAPRLPQQDALPHLPAGG